MCFLTFVLSVRSAFATAHRQLVKGRQRVIDGMVLRLPRGVQFVPPDEVERDGHLSFAIGTDHGYRSTTPDRAVVTPEGAVARHLLLVQPEAVGDLFSLLGNDWDSALHVCQ